MSGQPVSGHKGRDRWMCALSAASDLSTMAMRLALRLCVSFNCKTGQCDPGYPKLAEDMAVSKRSVSRAIDELETAGWVSVDRTGGDNTRNAQINLLIPAAGEPRSGDNILSSEKEPIFATSSDNMLSSENRLLQVTENAPSGDRNKGVQVTDSMAAQITCEPVNLKSAAKPPRNSSDAVSQSALNNTAPPDAARPNQRAPEGALVDHVNAQQPLAEPEHPPPCINPIGAAANGADADGGAHAGPGFDAVCRSASEIFGAKGDAVAARLLAALGDDVEEALDTLAVAADEADPMAYLKSEVERLRNDEGKLR